MFDFTKNKTIESVNNSLERLGLDYIDLIHPQGDNIDLIYPQGGYIDLIHPQGDYIDLIHP